MPEHYVLSLMVGTKRALLSITIVMFTLDGFRDDSFACKTSPATEDTCSDGALIAGVARMQHAERV